MEKNYNVKPLKFIPYGNARVETITFETDHSIRRLISYSTVVITENEKYMKCTGLYSTSTRKHIGAYVKEFHPELNYYDVKKMVEKGLLYDVQNRVFINEITGEVMGRV